MKKYIIFALIAVALPTITNASFDSNLSYGMANQSVLELQDFLYEQNCFPVQPTGFFGSITLASVKCFQGKYGIIQTGFFGSISRSKANELIAEATAPIMGTEAEEGTTTPPEAPITPPAQIIYIPSQEPAVTQPIMPTITGELPIVWFSDGAADYTGFHVKYDSSDFTQEQLDAIQYTVVLTDNLIKRGKVSTMKKSAEFDFTNLPVGDGKIEVSILAPGYDTTGLTTAYITNLHIGDPVNYPQVVNYSWSNS